MFTLHIPIEERFNEETNEFTSETLAVELEHSLASISKWESKWELSFLSTEDKTPEQLVGYLHDMCRTPNVPEDIFFRMTPQNNEDLNKYLQSKMTATWFSDEPQNPTKRDIITAEIIYNWMIVFNIPFEFEHRHLNQLLTLIRVCHKKSESPKKQSRSEQLARHRALNEERRRQRQEQTSS